MISNISVILIFIKNVIYHFNINFIYNDSITYNYDFYNNSKFN